MLKRFVISYQVIKSKGNFVLEFVDEKYLIEFVDEKYLKIS